MKTPNDTFKSSGIFTDQPRQNCCSMPEVSVAVLRWEYEVCRHKAWRHVTVPFTTVIHNQTPLGLRSEAYQHNQHSTKPFTGFYNLLTGDKNCGLAAHWILTGHIFTKKAVSVPPLWGVWISPPWARTGSIKGHFNKVEKNIFVSFSIKVVNAHRESDDYRSSI